MRTNFLFLKLALTALIITIVMPGQNIAQEHFNDMPEKNGWHKAEYDENYMKISNKFNIKVFVDEDKGIVEEWEMMLN